MPEAMGQPPAHVPSDRIVDIDVYRPAPDQDDPTEFWATFGRASQPLMWTPCNGGHWIGTRGEINRSVLNDHEHFSSSVLMVPRDQGLSSLLPTAIDPPRHRPFRMLINKALAPSAIRALEPIVRQNTRDLIAGFAADGEVEFISGFASRLPTGVFLKLANLPASDLEMLDSWMAQIMRPDGETTQDELLARFADYLRPILSERRLQPGNDVLSDIVTGQIGDRPITDDEAISMATTVVLGGLDTVVALMSFTMNYLANDPALQHLLATHPDRIPQAVEEFCRRFPVGIPTRLVVKDVERDGVMMKAGDLIVIPSILHALDESEYETPQKIDIDRPASPYSTFGHGVHRCPGSFLGKTEMRILLEEWLAVIPSFSLADNAQIKVTTGISSGIYHLPLVWERPQ